MTTAFDFFNGTPSGNEFTEALKSGADHRRMPLAPFADVTGLVAVIHPQLAGWEFDRQGDSPPRRPPVRQSPGFLDAIVSAWFERSGRSRLYHVQTKERWHLFLCVPAPREMQLSSCQFGYYERQDNPYGHRRAQRPTLRTAPLVSEIDWLYILEGAS